MGLSTLFLVFSSLLLLSTVSCNHDHHDHQNQRKEHSTPDSTPDFGKYESTQDSVTSLVGQSGTTYEYKKDQFSLSLGLLISIPIVGILFFVLCCYCICKCCCASKGTPGFIIMQNNSGQVAPPPPPAPQIIVQQPVYQQMPHEIQQERWAQQAQPPQWTPQPMGQQVQYSPNSAYDNPNYTGPMAPPPPYNTGKY